MWEDAAYAASQEGSMGHIPDEERHNEAQAFMKQMLRSETVNGRTLKRGLPMNVHTDTKQMGPLAGSGEGPSGTPQPVWETGTAESGWSKVSPTTRVLHLGTRYYA